jgi:broad specificity phosphatase PhoE
MVALFSHGDPIRLALGFVLGMPVDLYQRLRIAPASISAARFSSQGTQVLALGVPPGALLPSSTRARRAA